MAEQKQWVLVETLASTRVGIPVYFKCSTAIGPMSTSKLDDAERFDSRQAAVMSPAYVHPLSCYEPEWLAPNQMSAQTERVRCSRCMKIIYGGVYYDTDHRPHHRDCWHRSVSKEWKPAIAAAIRKDNNDE